VRGAGLAALAGAAGFGVYHAQVPTSQLYGATIHRRREAGPVVALTYDDGPNPRYTPALMDVLERHGAHATFFLIGRWAAREPGLVRAVAQAGHALGNHTWSHPTLALRSAAGVRDELDRCRGAVEAAGATLSEVDGAMLMRPPWGRRRPGTLRAVAAAGCVPVLWSITGYDWRPHTTAERIGRHCRRTGRGDVVLLHDGTHTAPDGDRGASVAATEDLVTRLGADGYRFVTVPELASA
jgi:peptidoglycan-N-acetylglucosamine deacetylase